jgi:hypothetical protein
MISSNGCVTHLREMFLKDHSVEVSFLGVWCIVWIHVLCMFQHAICHLHTKFCIPPSCLNFVFKTNWNYDKRFLFIFDSQLQQLLLKLIRSKNKKSIPSFSMVVTKFQYSQVMRIAALPSSPNLNFVPSRTLLLQFILPWKILTHPAWSNSHNFMEMCMRMCVNSWHMQTALNSNLCVYHRERQRDGYLTGCVCLETINPAIANSITKLFLLPVENVLQHPHPHKILLIITSLQLLRVGRRVFNQSRWRSTYEGVEADTCRSTHEVFSKVLKIQQQEIREKVHR